MTTKYLVKQAIARDNAKTEFKLVGTAILFNDPKDGIIKTEAYGDLKLHQKDKLSAKGNAVYVVSKEKPMKEEGKTISREVGTFVVQAEGDRATLFLHLMNDSYPAWAKQERTAPINTSAASRAEIPF
jgi:hypothetical protein